MNQTFYWPVRGCIYILLETFLNWNTQLAVVELEREFTSRESSFIVGVKNSQVLVFDTKNKNPRIYLILYY